MPVPASVGRFPSLAARPQGGIMPWPEESTQTTETITTAQGNSVEVTTTTWGQQPLQLASEEPRPDQGR